MYFKKSLINVVSKKTVLLCSLWRTLGSYFLSLEKFNVIKWKCKINVVSVTNRLNLNHVVREND
jgi:hypothetical protein